MRAPSRLVILAALVASLCLSSTSVGAQGTSDPDVAHEAGLQWGLEQIRAEDAWQTSTGEGVTIAVIDSGIALEHEDLASKLVEGVACRNTDGDPARCAGSPADHDGHGTHVAGIAAAATGNGVGVAGTAPGASIMPIKVLFAPCDGCTSAGNASDVTAAVRWAADHGADIINLSLGSTTSSVFGPGFVEALGHAWEQGAIPVVAAGNDLVLTSEFGSAPAVIVSATDHDDGAPEYSNGVGSAQWALAAPGGDGDDTEESCAQEGDPRGILSTYWALDDEVSAYACLSGTSMAAPFVSGALAILLGAGFDQQTAIDALLAGAVDIGPPGPDSVFGAGRLDIEASLRAAERSAPTTTRGDVSGQSNGDDDPGDDAVVDRDSAGDDVGAEEFSGELGAPTTERGVDRALPIAVAVLLILGTSFSTAVLAGRASLADGRAEVDARRRARRR